MELSDFLIYIVAVASAVDLALATCGQDYSVTTLKKLKATSNCTLYTSADAGMLNCGRRCNNFLTTCVYHSEQDGVCTMCMTEVVDEDSDPKDLSPADFTLAPTATIYEKSNFDDCSPNPCVHGTCEDKLRDYDCHCNEGFAGKNCDQVSYRCRQAGSSDTQHVSAGEVGVWSTAATNTVHRWQTNSWTVTDGSLQMLNVGSEMCGVINDDMFCRDGISDENPLGTGWTHIQATWLDTVDVSNQGHIWGVNGNLDSFHRLGTNDSTYGTTWVDVETVLEHLSQLTVGEVGVWGVALSGNIYYRVGTYGDNGSVGTSWQLVDGSAVYIDAGDNYVWICNAANQVYRRAVAANNPISGTWERLYGPVFKQISAQSDSIVWGVNTDNTVSSCIENTTCEVSYGPYGGSGGSYFTDENLVEDGDITQLNINNNVCVGLSLTYGSTEGPCHGGNYASSHTVIFTQGEYITAVNLRVTTDSHINQIQFITNSRDLSWYGNSNGNEEISIDSNGRKLAYISGRTGDFMDQINFHFNCL